MRSTGDSRMELEQLILQIGKQAKKAASDLAVIPTAVKNKALDSMAEQIARQTVAGGGALLAAASEPAAVLRENVASPGGTTAAALAVLMADDGLKALMEKAVAAAKARSIELG